MIVKQTEAKEDNYLAVVKNMIAEVKYGTVSVVVQDGKVVQVEQNKKVRIS